MIRQGMTEKSVQTKVKGRVNLAAKIIRYNLNELCVFRFSISLLTGNVKYVVMLVKRA